MIFEQDETILKFVLDTGSSVCVLDESSISKLKDFKFKCDNKDFENEFVISDLTNIREGIKEDSGVSIDGIVGSDFFSKYQYIIDFNKYIACSKKKWWSKKR